MPDTLLRNDTHRAERVDLAATFRSCVREGWHEAVANHFSLAVSDDGRRFLMNPNQRHFGRIRASDLILVDLDDAATRAAADPTAWGLHGAIHAGVPHARCAMHVHSPFATVLASLADSRLPAIDQNTAMFHGHVVVDDHYGGLAFEEEGARCAALFADPAQFVMVMGSHGILVIGETVAQTWNRLYYFERAAATYIRALSTGRPLRHLSDEVAAKTAAEMNGYPEMDQRHLSELKALFDADGSDYAD